MKHYDLLNNLNPVQQQAVSAPPSNMLVIAGAGSGKTRVLVHRIAWLIHELSVSPYAILAVTFTNKAAAEMRHRVEHLLNIRTSGMWIGTFHGLAHRLLRTHWQAAKLQENFQIIDSDDQYRLVKRILKNLELDEKRWSPKTIQWWINEKKDQGLRAEHLQDEGDIINRTHIKIYAQYQQVCEQGGLVDFAELLLRSLELLRENPDLLTHYQQRFKHILVDEFQDTNGIQYAWLKLLATNDNHMMIVGDDDQSIYAWRGAQVENIHQFPQEFANTQTIRLTENYRSTKTILDAANHLIASNSQRLGKDLWTNGADGDPIVLYSAFNEFDEAHYIAERIQQHAMQGEARRHMAILYRSNAQSRVLEESLLKAGIPYRIYGGLRFFERAEVKDALAYLRLILNRHDDGAFERVVNTPTRGIGLRTVDVVRQAALADQIPLWQAAVKCIQEKRLSARASNALNSFIQLIDGLATATGDVSLDQQTKHMLDTSGLMTMYQNDRSEKGRAKVENLQELISACKQFQIEGHEDMSPLAAFLSHAALEAGEMQAADHEDCVQMMTLHSAKGLEFPIVFLCGMEEGLFPHYLCIDDAKGLEEERRLCYVGITRAMSLLYLSYAQSRRIHGSEQYHRPSRFIQEIPQELIQAVKHKSVSAPARDYQFNTAKQAPIQFQHESGLQLGQRVKHQLFGEGTVLSVDGQGDRTRIQVNFDGAGTKWLMANIAKLEPV